MRTEKLRLKRNREPDLEGNNLSQEECSSKVKKRKSSTSDTAKVRILRSSTNTNNETLQSSPTKITKSTSSFTDSEKVEKSKLTNTPSPKVQICKSARTRSATASPSIQRQSSSSKLKHGIKKMVKKTKNRAPPVAEMKQHFRSCFKPLLSFLSNHNAQISTEFDEEMMKTPSGPLYKVFRKNIVKEYHLKKCNSAIIKIIQQFCKKEKSFKFGNNLVQLTMEDIAVIFGIPGAGKIINLFDRKFQERTEFVKRMWPDFQNDKHVSKTDVESALQSVLKCKRETDVKDYVRLMVTYIVMTIFSPSSSSRISWSFFPFVEVIENLNKIDWASTIHKNLIDQLCKWSPSKPWTITGCSLALLYFVCEHTNLIPQIEENVDYFPRFAKWNTSHLIKALETQHLDLLEDDKVIVLLGNLKQEEGDLLISKDQNEFFDIFQDFRESEINKLRMKVDSLENENSKLKKEVQILRGRLREYEEVNKEAENEEHANEDHGNEEGGNEEGGNEECGNEEGKNEDGGNQDGGNVKGQNDIFQNLTMEEEVKLLEYYCDETISQYWEKVNNPVPEINSGKLITKEKEQEKKKATKSAKSTQEKSSITRGVKLRSQRKQNVEVEKKDQFKKRKTRSDKSTTPVEAIAVEKLTTVDAVIKLKDVKQSDGWKNLQDYQKNIIENFFKTANRNTEVWKSKYSDVVIYGATLENLMFNQPLNNLVIDWYSYQLQSKQESEYTKSYFFPCHTFRILNEGNKDLIENSVAKIIKHINPLFGYWFFPINTSSPNSIQGHHWTLLQVDTDSWEWFHYNTLNPRNVKGRRANSDLCFKNAKKLRDMLIDLLKKYWPKERFLKVNINTKVKSMDCSQQNENPNCALYVCKFMDILSKNRSANEEDEAVLGKKMEQLRADLVYAMLTDEETCYKAPTDC